MITNDDSGGGEPTVDDMDVLLHAVGGASEPSMTVYCATEATTKPAGINTTGRIQQQSRSKYLAQSEQVSGRKVDRVDDAVVNMDYSNQEPCPVP